MLLWIRFADAIIEYYECYFDACTCRQNLSGADMSQGDYDNRTALHLAASEGHMESVMFLVEKCKVKINPQDR